MSWTSNVARRWLRGPAGAQPSTTTPWRSPGVGTSRFGCLRTEPPAVHTAVMDTHPGEVVLDTNVFVAAGFNPGSHSARIVEAVRNGRLRMVWDNATQAENQAGDTADTALVTESYRGPVPLGGPVLRFDGS